MSRGRLPEDPAGPGGGSAFDSHLHLTDARFEEDRGDVLARAREAGVREMVTVATDPADARRCVELARAESGVWATAGLHPHDAGRFSASLLDEVRELTSLPEVVAVGETGLDFHYDNAPRDLQRESFRAHLELAAETGLPTVVHSREADEETAAILREFAGRCRGVLHCFTGGDALLDAGLEADWHVSFSGILTFGGAAMEAQARRVPEDRLLVETDSPYLAPVPRRGRRNEPAWVLHTCGRLAELRGVPPEQMVAATRRNARAFYGLGPASGAPEAGEHPGSGRGSR